MSILLLEMKQPEVAVVALPENIDKHNLHEMMMMRKKSISIAGRQLG